jgi:NAD(P)-dependent dehydrogenase (short-subunit alcohol dehydrogenase family)
MSFEGKVVLITGMATGCGRLLFDSFAADGASVIGADIDPAGEGVAGDRRDVRFVHADVSREPEVESLVATAVESFGRLDCAINNAGTETTGPLADGDAAVFEALIETNLKGLFYCMKHEIAAMRTSGGGAILNMSSVTSSITAAPANGLYAATKGGVNALTKAGAIEVARDNISVNALAFAAIDIPGSMIWRYLETQGVSAEQLAQAFPVGRMGRPEELVAAVRYLCSDEARFCTGTTMILDGGYTAQ